MWTWNTRCACNPLRNGATLSRSRLRFASHTDKVDFFQLEPPVARSLSLGAVSRENLINCRAYYMQLLKSTISKFNYITLKFCCVSQDTPYLYDLSARSPRLLKLIICWNFLANRILILTGAQSLDLCGCQTVFMWSRNMITAFFTVSKHM